MDVTYRWVEGPTASQEDWDRIEAVCAARGWMSLNKSTSRILVAEADGELVGFHVFQMIPYCGPLFVRPSGRGTGIAEDLAEKMFEFLTDVQARGWITTTESPFAAVLAEKYGMTKLDTPVYVMPTPGGIGE